MSEFDSLTEEFNECRLLHESHLPDHVMESLKTDRGGFKLNSLWSFIEEMNDHAENALLLPRLWKVVRLILTIPIPMQKKNEFSPSYGRTKLAFGQCWIQRRH